MQYSLGIKNFTRLISRFKQIGKELRDESEPAATH